MFKLFKKKQQEQLNKSYANGWQTGYDIGSNAALTEAKKVFVKVLQKELRNGNIDYSDGIERAIHIIKEHK